MKIKSNGTQKEATIVNLDVGKAHPVFQYSVDYNSLNPEEKLRNFVSDVRNMVAKYTWNKDRIAEIEQALNDLEHFVEIGNFKSVPEGYRIYRRIAELRRERRACKNENDLLQPVFDYFHATEVLNRIKAIQGDVAKNRYAIDGRSYSVRTSVLDEFLPKDESSEQAGLNLLTGETEVV